ncbi:hypothetical protein J8273_3429 [Carpediemonas membranifera]|uniref:Uncharacterized protein n=1 Tax=Carpediemonas membranifera TaxID=201153 RepID=A0A8J6E1N9_9EUKA|nr:hypothetical protein J8273_3429 [Carpediemonas membranifera]|eukprot:KAG9393296.1 hypothetical protein J8273_3429 [Carpediemonas membranifera]
MKSAGKNRQNSQSRKPMSGDPYTVAHRIDPSKFSSDISLRNHPKPSLQAIKDCCIHYESKAAGNVSTTSPLARHLFNMSREVQSMVDELIQREQRMRIRLQTLQSVSEEWTAVFGDYHVPDTGEPATPSGLLKYLNRLELANSENVRHVRHCDNQIANMKVDHERQMEFAGRQHREREEANLEMMQAEHQRLLNELSYEFRLAQDMQSLASRPQCV